MSYTPSNHLRYRLFQAYAPTSLLGKDELIDKQNMFVSFKSITAEAADPENSSDAAYLYSWDGSGQDGDDLYFNVSLDGQTYTFVVEPYLCDKTTDVYSAVKELKVDIKKLSLFSYIIIA